MNRQILLLAGLLFASLPGAARADEPITLRYGQNAAGANGLSSLPLTVAQRKNFFVREGINLVVIPVPVAPTASWRRSTRARSMPARTPPRT
jgi:ABC-type nitrate/sulfonate/bicarbonate transport system substrate-binding protein